MAIDEDPTRAVSLADDDYLWCREEWEELFREFGVLAYSFHFTPHAQMFEKEEREYLLWSPILGDTEEEDEEIDWGPEEPDTYGLEPGDGA